MTEQDRRIAELEQQNRLLCERIRQLESHNGDILYPCSKCGCRSNLRGEQASHYCGECWATLESHVHYCPKCGEYCRECRCWLDEQHSLLDVVEQLKQQLAAAVEAQRGLVAAITERLPGASLYESILCCLQALANEDITTDMLAPLGMWRGWAKCHLPRLESALAAAAGTQPNSSGMHVR